MSKQTEKRKEKRRKQREAKRAERAHDEDSGSDNEVEGQMNNLHVGAASFSAVPSASSYPAAASVFGPASASEYFSQSSSARNLRPLSNSALKRLKEEVDQINQQIFAGVPTFTVLANGVIAYDTSASFRRAHPEDLRDSARMQATIKKTTSEALNARDPLGDGDQSPLKQYGAGDDLMDVWSNGGDFSGDNTTPFLRACYMGHLRGVNDIFQAAKRFDSMMKQRIKQQAEGNEEQKGEEPGHEPGQEQPAEDEPGDAAAAASAPSSASSASSSSSRPQVPSLVRDILEHRAGVLRLSGLLVCIIGSRDERLQQRFRGTNHCGTASALLDFGARPDCKDVAGYSALFHCCTAFATAESLKIATLLLKRGVSPDTANRFGRNPLHEAVQGQRADVADLLCNFGADPMRPDADGCVPLQMASMARMMSSPLADVFTLWQRRQALLKPGTVVMLQRLTGAQANFNGFSARPLRWLPVTRLMLVEFLSEPGRTIEVGMTHMRLSEDREEGGEGHDGAMSTCAHPSCGKRADEQAGVVLKRCSRCLAVAYCGAACQKAHWPTHKSVCAKSKESNSSANSNEQSSATASSSSSSSAQPSVRIASFNLDDNEDDMVYTSFSSRNLGHGKVEGAHRVKTFQSGQPINVSDGNMIVKIQRPMSFSPSSNPNPTPMPMMVYDRTRSFQLQIPTSHPDHAALWREVVRSDVANGLKVYLYAGVEGRTLNIRLDKHAPEQLW